MAIVARYILILAVVSVLISSQASAQATFFRNASVLSGDPPGMFSGEPLPDSGELSEERTPALESTDVAIEEEAVFDGNYWNVLSSGEWLNAGRWYSQADLLMLYRTKAQRRELAILAFDRNGFIQDIDLAMSTNASGFGYEPGTRLTLGKFLGRDPKNRDHSIEFSFFGMNEWSTGHTAVASTPDTFLISAIDTNFPGFNRSDSHSYSYKSNLNSYELNARVRSRLGKDRMIHKPNGVWQRESNRARLTSFFGGMRLVTIDEEFLYSAAGSSTQGLTPDQHHGNDLIKTTNDMFGVQMGMEIYEQTYNWSYGVRGKFGGMVNFADQRTMIEVVDVNNPMADFTGAANEEQLTLLLELSIAATYQLRPNMSLRFSYDFLYLQGLALAPEQFSFNLQDQMRIHTGSFTLFNGASFGFEMIW